jgi:glutamyl-tRNA(Gln) amidotransferase subunit E
LNEKIKDKKKWKIDHKLINDNEITFSYKPIKNAKAAGLVIVAVNLPGFKTVLSHFTQPGKSFTDEIGDRMKVVACLQKPFMVTSEDIIPKLKKNEAKKVAKLLKSEGNDAQMVFWAPRDDIKTALETIEERCLMAFEGVPEETRKSFEDGTTIFERVLPGADRMYPDTDSAPIPLEDDYIEKLKLELPEEIIVRYRQLKKWNIPEDTYTYIFSKNLYPLTERIILELKINPVFVGTFIGHRLKFIEGHFKHVKEFNYEIIYAMFKCLLDNKIELEPARYMLPVVYEFPKMDFDSVLDSIKFKKTPKKEIVSRISFLRKKFAEVRISDSPENEAKWIMGQLYKTAIGNIKLRELSEIISKKTSK